MENLYIMVLRTFQLQLLIQKDIAIDNSGTQDTVGCMRMTRKRVN